MITDACADWHKHKPADHKLESFKTDMDHAWKERNRRVNYPQLAKRTSHPVTPNHPPWWTW